MKGKGFFFTGGRAGGWTIGEREGGKRAGKRVWSFVPLQHKDALEQDRCQLWKIHLLVGKYASNNGMTKSEPVRPICIYSMLRRIHCLEHCTFKERSKHRRAKFSFDVMKSNFLSYHKVPGTPDDSSSEPGTSSSYLQSGHSFAGI